MKNTLKGYLIGVLSTILLIGGVAYAASTTKTIEALYNNIKIYVDGIKIDPKDASGNTVEPFIYNGTTYLPVRAVGEAIGKTVTWDGATQSVYLGEKPGDVQYLLDVCPPYSSERYENEANPSNGNSFNMGGKKYTNGFGLGGYGGKAIFNLDGKYKTLTLTIGDIDDQWNVVRNINIYLDDKVVKQLEMSNENLPKEIEIPLNYAMQLKIEASGDWGVTGFGNIIVE